MNVDALEGLTDSQKSDLSVAIHLAWVKYRIFFGESPHGTLPQIKALVELMRLEVLLSGIRKKRPLQNGMRKVRYDTAGGVVMRKQCGECGGTGQIVNDGPWSVCDDCDGEGYVTVDPEEERGIANCLDEGEERE